MSEIVMDDSEFLESDYSDESLRIIADLLGPWIANQLLLPGPVPLQVKESVRLSS